MDLKKFTDIKEKEIKLLKEQVPLEEIKKLSQLSEKPRDFLRALKSNKPAIIAEIKKASPSEGLIDEKADIKKIAREYEEGGASAISILTEKEFFHGNIDYLKEAKSSTNLPILRKDFIIDEYQIYESKAKGADALLLIVGILKKEKLERFIDLTHELEMECLIEIHDEEELNKISGLIDKINILGVNNRNLNSLEIDFSVIKNLIEKIPKDKIIISESGIKNKEDIQRKRSLGAKGFLIGTSLMKSENKKEAIENLLK